MDEQFHPQQSMGCTYLYVSVWSDVLSCFDLFLINPLIHTLVDSLVFRQSFDIFGANGAMIKDISEYIKISQG